ncbi:MAG: phosphatidate cytidylyltransferase [Planctomycetaceae bacterium]
MASPRELAWRLSLGPVLIGALVWLFALDARAGTGAPWLLALSALLVVRCTWELADLLSPRIGKANFLLVGCCALAVVASNWIVPWFANGMGQRGETSALANVSPGALPLVALSLAVAVLFANACLRYRAPGGNLETLGIEILCLAYVGVLISATAQLRWVAPQEWCYLPLASLVAVTKCGDTAAFFVGSALGGPKLSPLISPGKTIAGGLGALVGGSAAGWVCLSLAPRWLAPHADGAEPVWSLTYGAIVATAGIAGDLAESLIKRDVDRKDSSPLLPGFGGLLDLVDSVIFAGPVALALWHILPLAR